MIILFQNILFSKEFLACNGCFGLFSKIKKGSGASFWCTFSAWFFYKNVPYLILYQWTKFQCHNFFPSQDIKQNMLLCSSLDNWWHHKFKDLSLINLLSNGWQGEKGWRTEIQKSEYLKNEKNFLDETKNIFHSFERAIICSFGIWKTRTCDSRTPRQEIQRLKMCEKSHATLQVGVWWHTMFIPFRTP